MHNFHRERYIDNKGRWFSDLLTQDCFSFAGVFLADTLSDVLQNRRNRSFLRPEQQSVSIYSERLPRGDPRFWDYVTNRQQNCKLATAGRAAAGIRIVRRGPANLVARLKKSKHCYKNSLIHGRGTHGRLKGAASTLSLYPQIQ